MTKCQNICVHYLFPIKKNEKLFFLGILGDGGRTDVCDELESGLN
jgi:hypothetical protein